MLNWLEPMHLDVPLDLQNQEVQEQIIKGQQGNCGRSSHTSMGGVTTPQCTLVGYV